MILFVGRRRRLGVNDKEWIYDQVLRFITCMTRHEKAYLGKVRHRSEREVYLRFAPLSGHPFFGTRYSWDRKNRKVKRQMLAGALRRLIRDGKSRIVNQYYPNPKSMHGQEVSRRKSDVHLFGSDYDGIIRVYAETNVLQAMVDALETE